MATTGMLEALTDERRTARVETTRCRARHPAARPPTRGDGAGGEQRRVAGSRRAHAVYNARPRCQRSTYRRNQGTRQILALLHPRDGHVTSVLRPNRRKATVLAFVLPALDGELASLPPTGRCTSCSTT
jgi:hypothetical protein